MTLRLRVFVLVLLAAGQVSLHADGDTNRFAALIGLARVKRDAGDAGAARRYFEEAGRVRPLLAAELTEYFWVVASVDPAGALSTGRTVLSAAPRNAAVRDRMIASAAALHDEVTIVALARAGRQIDPSSARWPRRLGESYLRQGRPVDAVVAFSAAVKATTETDVHDRAGLAIALEASGRHTRALAAWAVVPPAIRDEQSEWTASRLRALAYAGPSSDAAVELAAWLVKHPGDDVMRIALVDLWARIGQPARALEALAPLLIGPASDRWLAREAELARAAGTPQVAIARLAARATDPAAPAAERWALADLLVDAGDYARGESVARAASPVTLGCDDRLLTLIDRIPGEMGTAALLDTLDARSCADRPRWLSRGIERAVAGKEHARALTLIHRLPAADASTPWMRRLEGQLLLWTGHAADAAATLEAVLRADPEDVVARQTLVDAYRTSDAPVAAWTAARPLLRRPDLPVDRRLDLATLALDAHRPDEAMAIVEPIRTSGSAALTAEVTGRARLMQGRAADAWTSLSAVDADALSPDGALALIDSASATKGLPAAIETSRHFRATTAPWRDVLARRMVLETIGGNRETSARLRAALAAIDPTTAAVADVEVALAQERPHDALALLDELQATTPASSRTNDLRATALEGIGDDAGAATLLSALMVEQPDTASFAIRRSLVEWRLRPQADTLRDVLSLPSRWPGNQDAAVSAATALASEGRFGDALAMLGDRTSWTRLPANGRLLAARSLLALGRSTEALDAIDDLPALTAAGALFRAQLVASVRGASAATAAFRAAAAEPGATPDVYLSWSAATASAVDRLDVLNAGARRFPANVPLLTALASAEWALRHQAAASAAAERAIAADAHAGAAWFVLVDAAAADPASLDGVLSRFDAMTPGDVALRIGMAEHVMGVGRSAGTGVRAHALAWLDVVPDNHPLATTRDLARVRVLAASQQWTEALRGIDDVLARDRHAPAPLRLKAEVLSWSGRDEDAIRAYDDYLAVAPQDIEARRQQARVATWAGRADRARVLYASLQAAAPDNTAIAAEAAAKNAFLAGHWEAAAAAYRAWLAVEPGNTEAAFELAESLRATNHQADADTELDRLMTISGHQLAFAARSRERTLRAPSFSAVDDRKNANGYDGQRLLDYGQRGGGLTATFGPTGATVIGVEGARLDASGGEARREGYRAGASIDRQLSPSVRLDGQVAAWTLAPAHRGLALWSGGAAWRATDVWTLQGGVQREAIIESLSTIDARLTASGAYAGAAYETSSSSFDARGAWQSLSDGNGRRRASLTYTHVVDERMRQVRAIVWTEALAYRDRAPRYFSPSGFLRADAGIEYTHAFSTPRFRSDRHNELAAGYLVGTDNRGTLYQHPTIRLNLELANGLAFDARGSLIRSATYNETAFTIGLRLVGLGSERR